MRKTKNPRNQPDKTDITRHFLFQRISVIQTEAVYLDGNTINLVNSFTLSSLSAFQTVSNIF